MPPPARPEGVSLWETSRIDRSLDVRLHPSVALWTRPPDSARNVGVALAGNLGSNGGAGLELQGLGTWRLDGTVRFGVHLGAGGELVPALAVTSGPVAGVALVAQPADVVLTVATTGVSLAGALPASSSFVWRVGIAGGLAIAPYAGHHAAGTWGFGELTAGIEWWP